MEPTTMNIFVTGANGQLGREMQRLGAVSPNNYIFTDAAELDVTDAGAVAGPRSRPAPKRSSTARPTPMWSAPRERGERPIA